MPPISLPTVERRYLDNTVLSSYGECPRYALYEYRLGRAPKGSNYPINFGGAYHDFREHLELSYVQYVLEEGREFDDDLAGLIYTMAFSYATRDWSDPPLEHKKSYLDIGRFTETCSEAYDGWKQEKRLDYYKVLGTETPFTLPLPRVLCHTCFEWSDYQRDPETQLWLPGHTHNTCPHCNAKDLHHEYFAGKMDQIIDWNGNLWVRDWKTSGWKPSGGWDKKFNPDHQFSGYTWAAKQLSGRRVQGVIIDIVYNIKTKGPEFHPTMASRSQDDIDNWLEWIEFEYALYRRSEKTGIWPMRTTSCDNWGGCYYRQACNEASWFSIEQWLQERTKYSVWDPMHPERQEEAA